MGHRQSIRLILLTFPADNRTRSTQTSLSPPLYMKSEAAATALISFAVGSKSCASLPHGNSITTSALSPHICLAKSYSGNAEHTTAPSAISLSVHPASDAARSIAKKKVKKRFIINYSPTVTSKPSLNLPYCMYTVLTTTLPSNPLTT